MNAMVLVNILLETTNPYDIDDPLEKPTPEEQAAEEDTHVRRELDRLLGAAEQRDKLVAARVELTNRQNRKTNPKGTFDNAGRWYPSADERQPCCQQIRSPSRTFPYSFMLHCRTVVHVANLFGVDPSALRRALRN